MIKDRFLIMSLCDPRGRPEAVVSLCVILKGFDNEVFNCHITFVKQLAVLSSN